VRPELTAIRLADPPELWAKLGFAVVDREVSVGGVGVHLGAPGMGIVGWRLAGVDPVAVIDGLATEVEPPDLPPAAEHDNGAVGIDHMVVVTPNFDRTAAALEAVGIPLRRIATRPDGHRMGFRRLGPAILELVEVSGTDSGPARFWGLVVVVRDLDALAARLGDQLGGVSDAVQPGRRIATLRDSAGLGQAMAFMTPEPR
jgi:hypothetical protein